MFSKFFSYLAQVFGGKGLNSSHGANQSQPSSRSQEPSQCAPAPVPCVLPSENSAKSAGNTKVITVNAGDLIPCDGMVIEGFAFVDESAIVGVSTPAMIEAGTTRNQVLADTVVVEGSLTIQCNQQ